MVFSVAIKTNQQLIGFASVGTFFHQLIALQIELIQVKV